MDWRNYGLKEPWAVKRSLRDTGLVKEIMLSEKVDQMDPAPGLRGRFRNPVLNLIDDGTSANEGFLVQFLTALAESFQSRELEYKRNRYRRALKKDLRWLVWQAEESTGARLAKPGSSEGRPGVKSFGVLIASHEAARPLTE